MVELPLQELLPRSSRNLIPDPGATRGGPQRAFSYKRRVPSHYAGTEDIDMAEQSVKCPGCGAEIGAKTEQELVGKIGKHGKEMHDVTEAQIMEMLKKQKGA